MSKHLLFTRIPAAVALLALAALGTSARQPVRAGPVAAAPRAAHAPAASLLGAAGASSHSSVAVDASGNVYVSGTSDAEWGPEPVRAFQGGTDAFVAKLDAGGALLWLTFLGGPSEDSGSGIAVSGGDLYVAGTSYTTWGAAPVRPYTAWNDAFVAKLSTASGALQWNTFLGGDGDDYGSALALDGSGNAYLAGTSSATWAASPVRPYSDLLDAFAAKLDSAGALQWNTFLGGTGIDDGAGIAADGSAHLYVAGSSTDAWGVSPVRPYSALYDAFAAELAADGSLQWHAFLGGAGQDRGAAVAVSAAGSAVTVAGGSTAGWASPLLPYTAWWDGFASRLDGAGALQWNTFLGSPWSDASGALALDGSGNTYLAGSGDAPWGPNPARPYAGGYDVHLVKLDAGGAVQILAFAGSGGDDFGTGIALGAGGAVVLAGAGDTAWGDPRQSYGDAPDAFALVLDAGGGLVWNTFFGGDPWTVYLPLVLRGY